MPNDETDAAALAEAMRLGPAGRHLYVRTTLNGDECTFAGLGFTFMPDGQMIPSVLHVNVNIPPATFGGKPSTLERSYPWHAVQSWEDNG